MQVGCTLPRYGLVISTQKGGVLSHKDEEGSRSNDWDHFASKLSRLEWTRTWRTNLADESEPNRYVWSDAGGNFPVGTTEPPFIAITSMTHLLHTLLDLMPKSGPIGATFDIVWIAPSAPGALLDNRPDIYGAFKRAVDWHNARLIVVHVDGGIMDELPPDLNARPVTLLSQLDCVLHRFMVWRGGFEAFNAQENSFKRITSCTGLELVAKDNASYQSWMTDSGCGKSSYLMSRNMTVVEYVNPYTIPNYMLTNTVLYLKLHHQNDRNALMPFFNKEMGIIARLSYTKDTSGNAGGSIIEGQQPKLTLNDWQNYVIRGGADDRSSCLLNSQQNQRELVQLNVLVINATDWEDKLCIVLQPNVGAAAKSIQVLWDTAPKVSAEAPDSSETAAAKPVPTVRRARASKDPKLAIPLIQSVIQKVQSIVLQHLMERDPACEHLKPDRMQETLMAIQSAVLDKVDNIMGIHLDEPSDNAGPSDMEETVQRCNEVYLEDEAERKMVAYADHLATQKRLKHRGHASTMAPSAVGEFVILEAKEMLKLFTKDGKARFPENCELLPTKSKTTIVSANLEFSPGDKIERVLKDTESTYGNYPEAELVKYHGLYYNVDEECEKVDVERMKYQRIHVGVNETISTCHVQNAGTNSSVVITKKAARPVLPKTTEKATDTKKSGGGGDLFKFKKVAGEKSARQEVEPKTAAPSSARRSPRKKVAAIAAASFPPVTLAAGSSGQLSRQQSYAASVRSGSSAATTHVVQPPRRTAQEEQERYKQKLRNAVYIALQKRGIDEKNQDMFRPCFKRLFEICKMYTKDAPKASANMSTTKWLETVAEQNADSVINLQRTYCKPAE